MAKYLSKLTVSGVQYDIKDAKAWADIEDIKSSITGAMHWAGFTTTALTDGATTNPIVIDGENYTAKAGDVVAIEGDTYEEEKEFVFNGTKWQKMGPAGSFKALAFKDSATGDVTCAGSNSDSAVSFSGTTSETVLKAIDSEAVAPSFTEGAFSAGTLPSFTEGSFSAGTLASFTEGAFTPASIAEGFVTPGTAASYSHSGFNGGSLGAATTDSFATEGVVATVDEANEILTLSAASTSDAVTAQGTFTAAVYGTDTFNGGTPTAIDLSKFDGGSKAADTFDAGSAATFTTESVITGLGTATAAAQTFTGSTVSVTVS